MRHEDYFKCLFGKIREEQKQQITQSLFKSIHHNVSQFHKQKTLSYVMIINFMQ